MEECCAMEATFSGEAEYCGIVKGGSVGLGAVSMLEDMKYKTKLVIHTDSSAAKSMASRIGVGKVRHIEVQYLWIQEQTKKGRFMLKKVKGEDNIADLLIKYLDQKSMHKLLTSMGIVALEGRASIAPKLLGATPGKLS